MSDSEGSAARDTVAVAVPGPFSATPLTYAVPEHLSGRLRPGHPVLVPLGRRRVTGWVMELSPEHDPGLRLRAVAELLDPDPVLDEAQLTLARQSASYYMHPIGEVLKTALPGAERTETRARYVLTEAGRARLTEPEPPPLLGALSGKGRRRKDLSAAAAELGVPDPAAALRDLERSGLVERTQVTDRKRRERTTVPWVELRVSFDQALAAFSRSGAVRDRLVLHLARRGAVPRAELTEQFPGAARIVKQLIERDLAVELRLEPGERPRSLDRPAAAPGPGDPAEAGAQGSAPAVREPVIPEPSAAQRRAVDAVLPGVEGGGFGVFALEGVTGSGKTEVYLRLAERALALGKGVLVLVPEIALTPQLEDRFRARLGEPLVLLHSGRTAVERHEAFHALRLGRKRVAVGVRSAVWAPVPELGLIVVDEEHDDSYKQDDGLRYNARDVAVLRAKIQDIPCVLGSATLSLETWHNAATGRYDHLHLPERVAGRPMPEVEVIKLEQVSRSDAEAGRWLSDRLLEELGRTLDAGEQALLLLNRRGFATYVFCGDCGSPFACPDCDTGTVFHARSNRLRCHLCGWWRERPETCPACAGDRIMLAGRGTERIEDELAARFPGARVDRMDRDTTRRRGAHAEILERFRRRETDVLVGTQMLAKGHDIPGVTLVGVIHADAGLALPDFRAPERTFQLLTQVAGRAGRGDLPGRVLFQAIRPEHPVIRAAAAQDAAAFRDYELRRREMATWPPYAHMALLRLDDTDAAALRRHASDLASRLRRSSGPATRLLGPVPPLTPRVAGKHRLNILLRAPDRRTLRRWVLSVDDWQPGSRAKVRVTLDVDPLRLI